MYYFITDENDLEKLKQKFGKDYQYIQNINSIKPTNVQEWMLLNKINETKMEGIIVYSKKENIKKMLELVVFLMDLDVFIILVTDDVSNYQAILGINVVSTKEELDKIINHLPLNDKNTRPYINNEIEQTIKILSSKLKVNDKIKRFVAMQIIYENPVYKNLLYQNVELQIIKEDLDHKLHNETVAIIDHNLHIFIDDIIHENK